MTLAALYHDNHGFHTFGTPHLATILFFAIAGSWLIHIARTKWNTQQQKQAAIVFAWSLFFVDAGWILLRIVTGQFNYLTDLPLDLCNLAALLMPILAYTKNKTIFNIFYFLVMAGTTQAIITPNLYDAFPHYTFLKYFYVHCGLVVIIFYKILVFKMRPTWRGMLTAFGTIQVYLLALMLINFLVGSNYAYVNHKPDTPSLLDYMGPYPWYLLVGEGVAVVFFLLYYVPFAIKDFRRAKREKQSLVVSRA